MTIVSTSQESSSTLLAMNDSNLRAYIQPGVVLIGDSAQTVVIGDSQGENNDVLDNAGTIMGPPAGSAIREYASDTTIINESSGTIENEQGGQYESGIGIENGVTDLSIQNAGLISSGGYGAIDNDGDIALVNTGTITGTIALASDINNGIAIVENYGIMSAISTVSDDPIAIKQAYLFMHNYGTITGQIVASEYGEIVNHGTIDGDINLYSDNFQASVTNDGFISGDVTLRGEASDFSNRQIGGEVDGVGGTIDGNIYGSIGNDTFDLSHQTVTGMIVGNGGSDTIAFASASAGFTIDLDQQSASGAGESFTFSGIENATGSGFADTIYGDSNANVIHGGAGDDTIMAGAGADIVYGNGGADTLNGNGGADQIIGGAGRDTLTGGAGADTFVYLLATDSTAAAPDLITDFTHGSDKIDLTALHLASAKDVVISSSSGLTYLSIDSDNNGSFDMIIKLTGSNVLTASDILGVPAASVAIAHAGTTETAPATVDHHDVATSLHAVAVDHGLYG